MKRALHCAMLVLALAAYGCGGSSSDPAPDVTHQVVGAVALPAATDKVYEVYLDDDGDPANGYIKRFQNLCDCGEFVDYYFDGVPAGSYYLYAITISEDGTQTFFGFYDPDTIVTALPPAPNVVVGTDGSYIFNFTIGVL